jgi:ADP-heptose:LPS heptosyltransferase
MKTKKKVILDEWFGKGAVVLLNIAARILGKILRIDHSIKPPKRIVVCKFLGMGSIIQATPLLQSLRQSFPQAEIIFVTSAANERLLQSMPAVDKVITIDDKGAGKIISSTISVIRKFWKHRPDLYIDLETYSYYSTALATLSCATNRFGFYRIERNIRMGVHTHMMFFNARAPIAQSYLQMGRLAGAEIIVEKLYRFQVGIEVRNRMVEKLLSLPAYESANYVVINPNASDLRIERRWPADKFISLITVLRKKYPEKNFILIGAANESEYVKSIHGKLDSDTKQRVFNTAGLFTLGELFALIEGCELTITNDTGPMHISFSFERPTIALFGPATPAQYGQHPFAYGIYKNIYCSPCVHDFLTPPCHGDNQCMKKITVEEVLNLCEEIFSGKNLRGETIISKMDYEKINKATLGILERRKAN